MMIAIVIVILFCLWWLTPRYVTPQIAGRRWNVASGYANSDDSARLLDSVNTKMIGIMDYMRKKYHVNQTDDEIAHEGGEHQSVLATPNDVHNLVKALVTNYDPDVFYENDPKLSKDTSYTLNKGESMHICTRTRDDPRVLESEDELLFVMLHEASHIANYRGWQHDSQFWEVFKFVLIEAKNSGIYKPVDYSKHPIDYCGLYVNFNPLYDPSIKSLVG